MDVALNQLRRTVGKAKTYFLPEENELISTIVRSHVQDIQEDIAALEKYHTGFKERETEILEFIAEARELKRDMEKEAFSLESMNRRKEAAPAPTVDTAQAVASSMVKLPRIKLPVFDGEKSDDYRGFMEAFRDSIGVEPKIGAVKKWLLLRAQLSGRAFSLVKELPTAPESYEIALKILEETYGSETKAITKIYNRILQLPVAELETESLRTTYTQLEGMILQLQQLGVDTNAETFLRSVVLSRYPDDLRNFLRIGDNTELDVARVEISEYIKSRVTPIAAMVPTKRTEVSTSQSSGSKGGAGGYPNKKPRHAQGGFTSAGGIGTPIPPSQVTDKPLNTAKKSRERYRNCIFCTGEHWNDECTVHKTAEERGKTVEDRCQKCLRPKHTDESECRSKRPCFYCKETTHNSALCPQRFSKVLLAQTETSEATSRFVTAMLPVGNTARTKGEAARAVLDTAGGRSLITEELATRLELSAAGGKKIRLVGVGGTELSEEASSARKLLLFPPGERAIEIDVFVVPHIVSGVVATDVNELKKRYPEYGTLEMPPEGNGEPVHLLIGYRNLTSIVTLHRSFVVAPQLQLMSTRFGWIPFGKLTEESDERLDSSTIGLLKEEDPLKVMCDLEAVGLADFLKNEDEEEAAVLEKFYSSIRRVNKRYEVEWPYRDENPEIEDNFGLAFGRLASLQRQLSKTPALLDAYDRLIRDQLEEGIVEPVNSFERPADGLVHYLPHRAVIRWGKSTPVRMVFDAAARCRKTARSLNDLILKGGNWVTEVPAILMRFRKYGVAVTSDIAKAFHQVSIAEKDRDVVRFLWLRDPKKPPSKENICAYRFRRMAFGVVASPFLLTATIKHHLRSFPNEFTPIVERDLYADNIIVSLPTSADSTKFYELTKACFAEMSMKLTQWTTDYPPLRKAFIEGDGVEGSVQNVLGLNWNVDTREMYLKTPNLTLDVCNEPTKRIALSEMASVYDPLGWAAPVVLLAKLFLRKVWNAGYTWDAELESNLAAEWRMLRRELNLVGEARIPRAFVGHGLDEAETIELHAFCDASADAYGVVVYLRVYENERYWTGIVAAKARLAPNVKLSIPRLELLAAVTAVKYLAYIERALEIENLTKYLWGDSRCVIAWTHSNKLLPVLVERSVKKIRGAKLERFSYVPTGLNPADVASRGATMQQLTGINWWQGPLWLKDSSKWPMQQETDEELERLRATEQEIEEECKTLLTQAVQLRANVNPAGLELAPFDLNPDHFDTMGDLARRTAYCLRAASRFLRGRGTLQITQQLDYRAARIRWLRWDQQRVYEPETVNKTNVSYLRNLKIFYDENGLIRCETRIKWAPLERNQLEPILLVKRSKLTKLIILSAHRNNYHVGTSHTLAVVRKQFWIPHGRREVHHVLHENCRNCRREWARPYRVPEMAPLPPFRISRTETPFTNVGVDAFGPYFVRTSHEPGSPRKKSWVLIFTCLVVRAVHLEVLRDMTAAEFMNGFRRFVGRRGVPKLILCDNAPEFGAIEGVFKNLWRSFAEADICEKYFAQHEIEWKFIPPDAPWMGGAYERLIKEVKKAFNAVYRCWALEEGQFEIAMIEIEGVLNSRPITYVGREEELELITPNDFLCLRYPALPLDFGQADTPFDLTGAWKAGNELLEQFWKVWSERYLQEIRERRERMPNTEGEDEQEPSPGELVLMIDPLHKRSKWETAVIERVIRSADGRVRSVQLRRSDHQRMVRPISKLASLKALAPLPTNLGELVDNNRAVVVEETGGEINLDN